MKPYAKMWVWKHSFVSLVFRYSVKHFIEAETFLRKKKGGADAHYYCCSRVIHCTGLDRSKSLKSQKLFLNETIHHVFKWHTNKSLKKNNYKLLLLHTNWDLPQLLLYLRSTLEVWKGIVPILYFIYSNMIYIIYFERWKVREWFQKYKYSWIGFGFFFRLLLRLENMKEVCGEHSTPHSDAACFTSGTPQPPGTHPLHRRYYPDDISAIQSQQLNKSTHTHTKETYTLTYTQSYTSRPLHAHRRRRRREPELCNDPSRMLFWRVNSSPTLYDLWTLRNACLLFRFDPLCECVCVCVHVRSICVHVPFLWLFCVRVVRPSSQVRQHLKSARVQYKS